MWHVRKSPVKLTSTMKVMSLCNFHLTVDEDMTAALLQSYKCRKWLEQFNLCTCLYFYLCFVAGQQKAEFSLLLATTVNDVFILSWSVIEAYCNIDWQCQIYCLLSGMKKDQGYLLFIDIVCRELFLNSENR